MAKTKITDYISHDEFVRRHMSGQGAGDIRKGIENGSIKSSYKPKAGGSGGNDNLPNLAATGSGANAPTTESVVNGVANGDWMNPNTSYIKSGAYLDNQNISDRGKGAMASFNRQGFNFDSTPSNVSQYSGIDSNASDNDKLMSYMYNNMRNMSPEQASEVAQGVQDLYTAAGRNDDVVTAYNNAVFGDGTGNNGLAAQEAQRNAAPQQGEYQLSNRAQRAQATSERDQLQAQLDDYKNGELYNRVKAENPKAGPAQLQMLVDEAYDAELRDTTSDLYRTTETIKNLGDTINNLTGAIDEEDRATAGASAEYQNDYITDNYLTPAYEFTQRNPEVARELAIQTAVQDLGWSQQEAYNNATSLFENMPNELVMRIANYLPNEAQNDAERQRQRQQYDNLMQRYALLRQNQREQRDRDAMNQVYNYQPGATLR